MIFIIINFLFNGFLLGIIYILGYAFMPHATNAVHQNVHHVTNNERFLTIVLFFAGFVTSGILTVFDLTTIGQSFLRLFLGGRKPIGRELQQIEPLLNDVILNCNQSMGTTYSLDNLNILIKDSKEPNAQAFGRNTILITEGLLKSITVDELKAVLAHELGHLYNKDSVILVAIIFGSFATRVCMWIYGVYAAIVAAFGKNASKSEHGAIASLLLLVPMLIFLPIILINWIGSTLLNLSLLFMGRKYEYRADKFAANLGYQAGLISFLEKSQAITEPDNSVVGRVFATHPVPIKRIGRLEDN
jgi:heat shock protein HtpX